jgi:hypothetical protein
MSAVKRLKKAAALANVSTGVLSHVSGYSRSTFSYWFRDDANARREPRGFRVSMITKLADAIESAHADGELPAEPYEAELVISKRMKAAR